MRMAVMPCNSFEEVRFRCSNISVADSHSAFVRSSAVGRRNYWAKAASKGLSR